MGEKFLIDTNVLIDFQIQIFPKHSYEFVVSAIDKEFNISFITYIEFLGYKDASRAMQEFIKLAVIIGIDDAVIDETIKLRKIKKVKLPDAIIAATAITHNFTLISRNLKDFNGISGLEVIDPHSL